MQARIIFLDNLRMILIFLVIVLHAGMTYVDGMDSFWIVSDPAKINSLSLVNMYLDLFVMFIIFFISGYFIPFSLKGKNTWGFLKSKFKRILLPWTISVLTLIPAYKVIFLFSRGLPQEEWISYFHLFARTGTDLTFFANNPTQNWLWFLPVLFLFQVLYLALSKLNLLSFRLSLKAGVLLTFIFGLFYSLVISFTGMKGWEHSPLFDFQRERLLVYFMIFLLGSLCNKLKVFESNEKNKKYYIISNVILTLSLSVLTAVALNLFFNILDPERNYFFITETFDKIIYYVSMLLSTLSFLHILIHVFRFNLNKTNRIMQRLNENSYAVYIIHMIVLGIFALILTKLSIPALLKYFILVFLTFLVSNGLVCLYRNIFKPRLTLKIVTATVLFVALFAIINLGRLANKVNEKNQSVVTDTIPIVGLHEAVILGNLNAIMQHINFRSDLDEGDAVGGSSPLITAATFGKTEIAKALINAGAEINFKNNEGSTALHAAAFFCNIEIVEYLLIKGADPNIRNNTGSTALDSVIAPFEEVEGFYNYFKESFAPLGLELDYGYLKLTRPKIARLLQLDNPKFHN